MSQICHSLGIQTQFPREVGCGANAYWSRWMHTEGNVDVVAIDISLDSGGKILSKKANKNNLKNNDRAMNDDGFIIHQGGPETLSQDETIRDSDRTLFLCYPDEEDKETPTNDEGDEAEEAPLSMAAACLEHYTGSTVIHVGELYGDTLSLDQAPFGRSSSSEFQTRLAGEYHCILKMQLESNWLHTRDTLSVWKRSEACCMAFEKDDNDDDEDGDDDDGSDEDMYYKYIPPTEQLPVDVAAPCVVHLLNNDRDSDNGRSDRSSTTNEAASKSIPQQETNVNNKKSIEKKRKKKKKKEAHDAIAGNAW